MAVGKEYNVEKRERGSDIICFVILRMWGRILSGEEGGEGDGNFSAENQD